MRSDVTDKYVKKLYSDNRYLIECLFGDLELFQYPKLLFLYALFLDMHVS